MRIVDKGDPGDQQRQAGHVIAVCPDGWLWSDAEKTSAEWMIIHADITQAEADALSLPPATPNSKKFRKFKINIAGVKHGDKIARANLMSKVVTL